jgi:hypothetical protein
VRGGGGSAIDTDERPREGEGCSWCASKGKWREGKRGATASGDALLNDVVGDRGQCLHGGVRRKERGAWRGGGRPATALDDAMPRGQGSPRG